VLPRSHAFAPVVTCCPTPGIACDLVLCASAYDPPLLLTSILDSELCAGKFGGLFASMPQAMVSGLFCVMFGLIAAVGISQLQFTDANSPRNIFIVGIGLYLVRQRPRLAARRHACLRALRRLNAQRRRAAPCAAAVPCAPIAGSLADCIAVRGGPPAQAASRRREEG